MTAAAALSHLTLQAEKKKTHSKTCLLISDKHTQDILLVAACVIFVSHQGSTRGCIHDLQLLNSAFPLTEQLIDATELNTKNKNVSYLRRTKSECQQFVSTIK